MSFLLALLRRPALSIGVGIMFVPLAASFLAPPVWACSCGPMPPPACRGQDSDEAVFLFTAVSVTEDKHFSQAYGRKLGNLAEARIDQRFWGVPEWVGESITIYSGYPCDWLMEEGEQYLAVVHKDTIRRGEAPFVHISSCGRTRVISRAKADLRLLAERTQKEGRRVVGQVLTKSLSGYGLDYDRPISGARVTIRGDRRDFQTTTDADGLYDITGLSPGFYTATVELHKGLTAPPVEIDLGTRLCADGTISATPTGGVRGVVIDSNGGPVRASIMIGPAASAPAEWEEWKDVSSDEEGRFHLKNIPAGEFWIGINLRRAPSRREPFQRSFYPGVTDLAQAMRIQVGTGTVELSAPFRLDPLPLRPIRVEVKDSSGAAVPRATVLLHLPERGYFDPPVDLSTTDPGGFALLHAPERRTYVVKARLMELKGSKYVYTCSEELALDAELNSPLTLVVTIPCKHFD